MSAAIAPLLVLVLLSNFFVLATSRLRAVVNVSALQGAILGVLAVVVHREFGVIPLLMAAGTVAVKTFFIPWMLGRAMRDVVMRREVEPFLDYVPSLVLGALGTGLTLLFADTLPLAPEHRATLLMPTSFSTVLTGFLVLTTRRKAITQVVGYLILENGIFIMGLSLVDAIPFVVELGVLLDLFVAIFVMGIIINQISREFGSLDTRRLSALKE